ncbi:MFS transporter [Bacillus cereus group sp. N21]|uniref:MFS transporter n=1 Tax=Bacillus cereus group sp. N21 TaxID=2794591 RepID=UPI0018F52DA9|nr:MFS transporter [Bacillus cereus group sp. N21]MBJ8031988.1 MFS transporter [Bacillus cereus group sp. N21]
MNSYRIKIFTISLCAFASVMSTSMLTIAFPDITKTFDINFSTLQIRNILFFAFFATGIPLFGKISDMFGAKRILIIGLLTFTFSTILSGITTNWYLFLGFQSLQAIADAMIVPAQVLLIRSNFEEDKIGWAFGWFSGVLAVATFVGPALGGLIVRYFKWQAIFGVLCCFSIIALLLVLWVIKKDNFEKSVKKVQIPFKSSISLLLLVLAIQILFIENVGIYLKLLTAIFVIVMIFLFVFFERKSTNDTSLIPKKAIHNPIFISALTRVFLLFLIANAITLYIPTYMRENHGIPPEQVGWILVIDSVISIMLSGYMGRLADLKDNRLLILIGVFFSIFGMLLLAVSTFSSSILLFIFMFLFFGMAGVITMPSQNKIAMLSVPKEETGVYMGLFQMVQFGTGAFAAGIFSHIVNFSGTNGGISNDGFLYLVIVCIALYFIVLFTLYLDKKILKKATNVTENIEG